MAGSVIDFERDWSGECRKDPSDGNAYILRSVAHSVKDGYVVVVNDVMGGHTMTVAVDVWLRWPLCAL